jgi:hypothetical protein
VVVQIIPDGSLLLGDIREVERIARGPSVRQRRVLKRKYGNGKWRKLKGIGLVQSPDGSIFTAELHWFEAHGIGKKEIKIKRPL